ncbi:hypothetical protein AB0J52_09030 [Spirillospora sp. NPDC049652]
MMVDLVGAGRGTPGRAATPLAGAPGIPAERRVRRLAGGGVFRGCDYPDALDAIVRDVEGEHHDGDAVLLCRQAGLIVTERSRKVMGTVLLLREAIGF